MGTFNFFLKPYKDINNADERIKMLFQRYGGVVILSPDTPDEMSRGYISVNAPGLNSNDTFAMADITNSLGRFGSEIMVQDMDNYKCEDLLAKIEKHILGWEKSASRAMSDYGADSYEYGFARECLDGLKMFKRDLELKPAEFKSVLRYYLVEAVNALKSGKDTTVGKARSWTSEYKKGYLAGEAYTADLCLGLAADANDLPMQIWQPGGTYFRKNTGDAVIARAYLKQVMAERTSLEQLISLADTKTEPEQSVLASVKTGVEINDSALFDVTVNGVKLSNSDLADLHSYYEACCTAEYLTENYKLDSAEEALSLGYDVRHLMDKYDYDEDYAISEVMSQYLKHTIGET